MMDDLAIQADRDAISQARVDGSVSGWALDRWSLVLDALVEVREWGCQRPDWPDIWRSHPPFVPPDVPQPAPFHPGPEPYPPPDPHVNPGPHIEPHPGPHGRLP
jgi:hypothetical protein